MAIICCSLRFLARIRTSKKLLIDDYLVLFAVVLVLVNAIIWQIYAGDMYHVMKVSASLEPLDEDFAPLVESYFKSTMAVIILF